MLQFLTYGVRRFGSYPMPPHFRLNWEFYAVIEGKCSPVFLNDQQSSMKAQTLWVFPPQTFHGWRGELRKECRIACFHFASVPSPLRELAENKGYHECPLSVSQASRLKTLGDNLSPLFENPTTFSHLHFESALMELTFIALSNVQEKPLPGLEQTISFKVQTALAWYADHLTEFPQVEDVASAMHISVSNLRRLFMLALNESPQSVFKRIRLQLAMKRMSETNEKMETVAKECGYRCASDFSRAFSKEFKVSPKAWRENDYRAVPNTIMSRPWLGLDSGTPRKPFVNLK